jgi:hypothetical protein
MAIVPPLGNVERVRAVAVDNEGWVLAAGANRDGSSFIVRARPDKRSVDARYGTNFRQWLDGVRERGQIVEVRALLPQASGKVVVAGSVYRRQGLQTRGPFVVRLNADGTVDQGFRKYGGPPDSAPEFQMMLNVLGMHNDGTLVAGGRTYEIGGRSMGWVIELDPAGRPFLPPAPERWCQEFAALTCCAADAGGRGLIFGGRRLFPDSALHACSVRMLTSGAIDQAFGYGGQWFTMTADTGVRAVAVTRFGTTVAVGHKGEYPAMFLMNSRGWSVWNYGEDGVEVLSQVKGVATDLYVDGDRIVVCLETDGLGFILLGFELTRQKAPQGRLETQRPISRRRSPESAPQPASASRAPRRGMAASRAPAGQSAASVAAQAKSLKLVADSMANMQTANAMLRVHQINLSTQRF